MVDFSEAPLPIADGASTSHNRPSDIHIFEIKRKFANMIQADFPQMFKVVIRAPDREHRVYVIDIAAFARILRTYKAFPEGHAKNIRLLQWAIDNKDYLEFMLL